MWQAQFHFITTCDLVTVWSQSEQHLSSFSILLFPLNPLKNLGRVYLNSKRWIKSVEDWNCILVNEWKALMINYNTILYMRERTHCFSCSIYKLRCKLTGFQFYGLWMMWKYWFQNINRTCVWTNWHT